MMWSEKHRPREISQMLGNEEARAALLDWFSKWRKGAKPVLLVGPPGVGKTTVAYLAARRFGYDAISLNASDARSKSRLNEILGPILANASVMGNPMIFIDEVDGVHGRADYGGAEALIKIFKEPTVPIVLAANSDSSDKMQKIKKATKAVQFRPLPPRLMRVYLRRVLEAEGAKLSPGAQIRLVSESRGDIRSMINTAQSMVTGFLPPSDGPFEQTDAEEGINSFFKARTALEARSILFSMRMDPREKIGAFYSSVISSSLPEGEAARMLAVLSNADVLYGKILRTQQWRLLRYLDAILVRLFAPGLPVRYSKYNLPWPLLNRIRWDGRSIREASKALGGDLHVSRSTFVTYCLPFILRCMKMKKFDPGEEISKLLEKELAGAR